MAKSLRCQVAVARRAEGATRRGRRATGKGEPAAPARQPGLPYCTSMSEAGPCLPRWRVGLTIATQTEELVMRRGLLVATAVVLLAPAGVAAAEPEKAAIELRSDLLVTGLPLA